MNKMSILFLPLLIFLLGCTDNNSTDNMQLEGDVQLNFRASFENDDLVMYDQTYSYEDDMSLRFQLFQFYISHVALVKEMQDTINGGVELLDVALVSYQDIQSVQAAEEGVSISLSEVPAGLYKGIKLGIGVADDLNVTQPGDHPAGHPLSDNYWTAATGYIFTKIEGNADLDGSGNYDQKLTFHIGAGELYREKMFIEDIEVPASGLLNLNFSIDVNDILVSGGDYLDFRTVNQDHTNNMEVAAFIANNLAAAINMDK